MSLDNRLTVKRSYAALEPKTAADKYEREIEDVKTNMEKPSVIEAYKAMFKVRKDIRKTLGYVSSAGLPGQKKTGPSLIENPDNFDDEVSFANACKAKHQDIINHLDEKGGFAGLYHVNREVIPSDLMTSLVKWYRFLAQGTGGMIAALSVFDSGVRSAVEAKPEEDIKTREQKAAEEKEKLEKSLFTDKGLERVRGKLGGSEQMFIKALKDYNEKAKPKNFRFHNIYSYLSDQQSSFEEDPLSWIDGGSKGPTVSAETRLAPVIVDGTGRNFMIMQLNGPGTRVIGPEPFTRENRDDPATITHDVLIRGNPKKRKEFADQDAKQQAQTKSELEKQNNISNLSQGSGVNDSVAQEILSLIASENSKTETEIANNYYIEAVIPIKTQAKSRTNNLAAERTSPANYYNGEMYLVSKKTSSKSPDVMFVLSKSEEYGYVKYSMKTTPAQKSIYQNLNGKYIYRADNSDRSRSRGYGELKGKSIKDKVYLK